MAVVMNNRPDWISSPRALALLWVALVMSLSLGIGVVAFGNRAQEVSGAHGTGLTDAQAASQVVDAAREIVAAARLQRATGGYTFVSCTNENDPPYQATLYMTFALPQDNSSKFLHDVASAMVGGGWTDTPADGENFGQKLTKSGVTSVFYRNPSRRDFATMRLYGQCRDTSDHRHDNPAWIEVGL
jgi:hypothetical protein